MPCIRPCFSSLRIHNFHRIPRRGITPWTESSVPIAISRVLTPKNWHTFVLAKTLANLHTCTFAYTFPLPIAESDSPCVFCLTLLIVKSAPWRPGNSKIYLAPCSRTGVLLCYIHCNPSALYFHWILCIHPLALPLQPKQMLVFCIKRQAVWYLLILLANFCLVKLPLWKALSSPIWFTQCLSSLSTVGVCLLPSRFRNLYLPAKVSYAPSRENWCPFVFHLSCLVLSMYHCLSLNIVRLVDTK